MVAGAGFTQRPRRDMGSSGGSGLRQPTAFPSSGITDASPRWIFIISVGTAIVSIRNISLKSAKDSSPDIVAPIQTSVFTAMSSRPRTPTSRHAGSANAVSAYVRRWIVTIQPTESASMRESERGARRSSMLRENAPFLNATRCSYRSARTSASAQNAVRLWPITEISIGSVRDSKPQSPAPPPVGAESASHPRSRIPPASPWG